MKKLHTIVFTCFVAAALPLTSCAQQYSRHDRWEEPAWRSGSDWRPGIKDRINHIRGRINRGIDDGSLDRGETRSLLRELDDIKDEVNAMKSDGYISDRERSIVMRRLDHLEEKTQRLRHNGRRDYR